MRRGYGDGVRTGWGIFLNLYLIVDWGIFGLSRVFTATFTATFVTILVNNSHTISYA
jgi:hypothetical protein